MTAILDTSFLFALSNHRDRNHARVLSIAQTLSEPLILPSVVLPEVCYLLASRLGHQAMRSFLKNLASSDTAIENLIAGDVQRIYSVLEEYADGELDFVDAAIVAIAERKNITRVLTLDRRDFSIIRPKHCNYFQILP